MIIVALLVHLGDLQWVEVINNHHFRYTCIVCGQISTSFREARTREQLVDMLSCIVNAIAAIDHSYCSQSSSVLL